MLHHFKIFLSSALTLSLSLGADYQTAPLPDRIEEDWQVVLGKPDNTANCPQFSTVMSPTGVGSDPYLLFELNYRDQPRYRAGGLSAQLWRGRQFVSNSDQGTAQCKTPNETI